MADNVIIKPEKWASAALGLLETERVLSGLVSRDPGNAFTGAKGDTVNVKRPSLLSGTVEALRDMDGESYTGIQTEALNERSFPVKVDKHVYSAVDLTDAELTLDITEFGAQVLTPQVKAIATRIEYMLAQKFNGLPAEAVTGTSYGDVRKAIVRLRKLLNTRDVPQSGRILVVGVDVEEHLLNDPNFIRVDYSGTDSALRSAELGRIAGFRVYVSNVIDADRMVALHPSAYTLVTRAPRIPGGVASGESTSYGGVALRAVKDYNSVTAKDRSFISTFAGVGEVLDPVITRDADGKVTVGNDQMLRAAAVTVTITDPPENPEAPDPSE
ncbi:P22 phage major capsid protein family protein [Nocardiopsis alba]|uniref:P22 phage major capsid protein family protein n=1 Tax=Nocardiopsis alba TaxID=53437 RepID=UPI00380E81B8